MLIDTPRVDTSSASSATPSTPAPAVAQLELISWSWRHEYGYAIAEGRVTNISAARLENVSATVTFNTQDGTFITTDDALLDLNPILPGQTSSFKVMARYNPAMRKASVDFKYMFGGSINWRQRERSVPAPRRTRTTPARPDSL